ncbi:MAG: ethanolamine ammonia-lyase subunit EutC [Hyphomicrobium sp.]
MSHDGPSDQTPDGRSSVVANPWGQLRRFTPARIALGRSGTSLPTAPHLDFQLAHARARKAVHHELDAGALRKTLEAKGHSVLVLDSAAETRPIYLQRPDMGRRLAHVSRLALAAHGAPPMTCDVAIVIGDGLSAMAIEQNAVPFLDHIQPVIERERWSLAPLIVVRQARVAIGDEIGEILGAGLVVVLIGERPGLSSPDSMGIYMTLNPRRGMTDETRNCISNVRREGLSFEEAAHKLHYLMGEARRRQVSGVLLKDEAEGLPRAALPGASNFLLASD